MRVPSIATFVSLLLLPLYIVIAAKVSTIALYEEAGPDSKDTNFLAFDKNWTNKAISRWQYQPVDGENPHARFQLKPKCQSKFHRDFVIHGADV